jgi:predicted solute-binding protein
MNKPVRLGAVDYLNVRPLVHGLDRRPDLVSLRFDAPSECARLLQAGEIDLGMVPSITYLNRPGDRIVPGVCIGSDGPVESVALFLRTPLRDVRTLAVDTSSRTSVALTRILCARRFGIDPTFVPHAPDINAMLAVADGALVIGDPALFADHRAIGAEKIDLGLAWTEMTGLPFVWAFWAGRPDAASPEVVTVLHDAARSGLTQLDAIANAHIADPVHQAIGRRYLRESLMFQLSDRALDGLRAYYREALTLGVAAGDPSLTFFGADASVGLRS